ncbi:DUF2218 domain-containing protein [Paracoccaceae bacterium GXU_MW_L88]
MKAKAVYETAHAAKYLQQLAKHFAHKIEVELTDTRAAMTLADCEVELLADDTALTMSVTGMEPKDVINARYVIDKHLVTFAFREEFIGMNWV